MSYDTKALVLVPMFASNTVTVMRGEEAYSFLSLVSDCGGLRGLFIGFNFLMLWDSVVWALKRITRKALGDLIMRCMEIKNTKVEPRVEHLKT